MKLSALYWLVGALAAGWLLVGCDRAASGPARQPAQAAARPAGERITGVWRGTMLVDDEATAGKLDDQQRAELEAMQMGMEFLADGSLLLTGVHHDKPYTSRNRWELLRAAGDEITIKSVEPSGHEKEIVLVFEGEDVFLLPMKTEVAELGAMRFERVR